MTIEQAVEIPASHWLTVKVPREVPAGRAILAFTPAPVETTGIPRFTAAQIEEAAKSPEIQTLIGALEGADLPPGVTLKDIRKMRLAEKYGE